MTRPILISMIIAALVPLSFVHAASLGGATSTKVGSGQAAIVPCDADGFTPTYTTSGGNITSVTVSGIADPRCEGTTLKLTVVDGSGAAIASGGPQAIPTDGDTIDNSMVVLVSPQPAAAAAAGVHISVVEP